MGGSAWAVREEVTFSTCMLSHEPVCSGLRRMSRSSLVLTSDVALPCDTTKPGSPGAGRVTDWQGTKAW